MVGVNKRGGARSPKGAGPSELSFLSVDTRTPYVADAGGDTRVPTVQKNKPSLVFLVPNLADGTYHLEVRARTGSGTPALIK